MTGRRSGFMLEAGLLPLTDQVATDLGIYFKVPLDDESMLAAGRARRRPHRCG